MRLALFHNLPSGGAKRALAGAARCLVRSGWRIDVFQPSTADDAFADFSAIAGRVECVPVTTSLRGIVSSTVRYVPPIAPFRVSLADLERAQAHIAALIDGGGYDAVVVEQDRFTMAPFVLRHLKSPAVYSCPQPSRLGEAVTADLEAKARRPGWRARAARVARRYTTSKLVALDRRNATAARFVIANSCFSREVILRAYGIDATVCYPGVDVELFTPRAGPREEFVLSVGFLGPAKGHDFVLRSLARIEAGRRPPLVVIANGASTEWRGHVEKIARDLDVRLEIRILVSDAELVEAYRSARLLVYAPYLEPLGLAPVEAMACGTPVVAVREGGIRETVVDGATGILTDRDETAFADAVTGLLADEPARAGLGARGPEHVARRFTLQHAADRLARQVERAIRCW